MIKFWAKVRIKQDKNAEYLIRAFFQDFNPESSIVVRGKEAKLEIVFRQPPMAIIDAISHCEVIELNYGKNLKGYEEDEKIQVDTENDYEYGNVGGEDSEETEQTNAESEKSEQAEQANAKSEKAEQANAESKSFKQTELQKKVQPKKINRGLTTINIPKLEEIAKIATSFENFAKLVSEWLEMGQREDFFTNLVIISTKVDKITWKELENALKNKKVFYTQWDKVWSSKQVSERLKEYSITILSFLNVTKQYKEYSFKGVEDHSTEENSNKQEIEETTNVKEKIDEFDDGKTITKPRVKMECMPEIRDFEETLASVDKTQPVEKRIRYVLEAMGLNKMTVKEQEQIVEIASTAVKKERIAFDIIFIETNIPIEQTMTVRMTFSKFVNDFVQKYESGKKVKLLTFLSELQKIIMFESEIENFSDFTQ